ncbi:MAG: LamG domain-containing protein [Capnocytophaga sp.]|nr:LamG domain-containing protein [Capnocytophaga sp.]
MKRISRLTVCTMAVGTLFGLQSCFQDLDNDPAFDYPEQPAPAEYSPRKLALTFEEEAKDQSNYKIQTQAVGNPTYVAGKVGKAYQGSETAYILASPNPAAYPGDISVRDTIANLGSFTIAFWMNTPQATKATGVFSISNTKTFWGNLDIFMESNAASADQAFMKMHLYNGTNERWVEARVEQAIGQWLHMAFRYDQTAETMTIFKNGTEVYTSVLTGFGAIKFNNMGEIAIGALQFQTSPSLTESASAQDWASNFTGMLDQFYFYNKALSDTEITALAAEN